MRRAKCDCCAPTQGSCAPSPAELERAAFLFRALGDRTRLAILRQLRERGEVCACDFGCSVGQPTLSHHLKILRRASLVRAEKRGLWVFYTLDSERLAELRKLVP